MARYAVLRLDDRFRFHCTRCDRCCGTGPNVSLTCFDVVRLARFLKIHWRSLLRGYVNVIVADVYPFMSLRGDATGRCLFLYQRETGETGCAAYPARPMRCRLYPLIVESGRPRRLYLDLTCPGVGSGPEKEPPRALVEAYAWELRRHYGSITRMVLEEGLEPVEALERLLEEAWKEAEEGAQWADLDWLESLGHT